MKKSKLTWFRIVLIILAIGFGISAVLNLYKGTRNLLGYNQISLEDRSVDEAAE